MIEAESHRIYREAVARNTYERKIHTPQLGEVLAVRGMRRYNWKNTKPHISPQELQLPAHLLAEFPIREKPRDISTASNVEPQTTPITP